MSKSKQSYPWLNNKPNLAKTIVERAKREVLGFAEHYKKFEQQTTIGGYSKSTIYNYSRAVGITGSGTSKQAEQCILHGRTTGMGIGRNTWHYRHMSSYGLKTGIWPCRSDFGCGEVELSSQKGKILLVFPSDKTLRGVF